jgi:hypothetical protein
VASTDAGALCFIALLYLLHRRERFVPFVLTAILGVLQKETVLIAIALYLVIVQVFERGRSLRWFLALGPAAAVYLGLRLLLPAPGFESYASPAACLRSLRAVFLPGTYTRAFVFHVFLGNLPLLAAGAAHGWLRVRRRRLDYPMPLLLMPLALFMVGMMFGLGNNVGRIVAFAMPWTIPYEMAVLWCLWRGPCRGPASADTGDKKCDFSAGHRGL